MAAAVSENREPLVPLYPLNSQDLGRQSPALRGKPAQRPKLLIRKSASLGASRSLTAAKAELTNQTHDAENFASLASPQLIAEDSKVAAMKVIPSKSRSIKEEAEEQGESAITSGSPSGVIHRDDGDNVEVQSGDNQESIALMQMRMEAMTWAGMAKDYTISSLERRLRQALEIAKAEQERNQELGRLLRESKQREAAAAVELQDANEQIMQLSDAEERLCVQLGDLEVEAIEEDRRYRSQIATLTARIEAQDRFIAGALKSLNGGEPASPQHVDSFSYLQDQYQSLVGKLERAENEIDALSTDLSDAQTQLRVANGLKKSQLRRLKALEKERWYLMRKRAVRSVRFTSRAPTISETEAQAAMVGRSSPSSTCKPMETL